VEAILLHQAVSGQEAQRRSLFDEVKLPDPRMMNRYPHRLRRSAAAGDDCDRIGGNPAVLIADEPTTALDVTIQAKEFCCGALRP